MFTGAILLILATSVGAAPGITFPINSQVPPVAQVAKPFSFVFSSFTFTSNTPSINYILKNPPQWLQLDGASRTLSGTPGSGDVGAAIITLTATDSTGSTDMTSTLVVSASPGPSLGIPAWEQLSSFGTISNQTTLALYPSTPFSFSFKPETFSNTNGDTVFYAISADNAPLPSWIRFEPGNLKFSGTTPPMMSQPAPPEYFGIQLTASDVVGFAGATTAFTIVVGTHELAFTQSQQTLNISQGSAMNLTSLRSQLKLDGKPIADQDLEQATADIPSWLTFDNRTLWISGTPPREMTSQNISVSATDVYGNSANTTILLQITSTLFTRTIGNVNATIGHDFSYSFSRSLFTDSSVQVSVDLGNAFSWLGYDPSTMRLQGHVPSNTNPQQVLLNVIASEGPMSDDQTLTIIVSDDDGQMAPQTSSSSAAVVGATSSPSSKSAPQPQPTAIGFVNGGGLTKGKVAAAVVMPIVALLAAVSLFLCYLKRRRNEKSEERSLSSLNRRTSRSTMSEDNPGSETMTSLYSRTSSEPPRLPELSGIQMPAPSKRNSQHRLSKGIIDEESGLLESASKKDVVKRHSEYVSDRETGFPESGSVKGFPIAHDDPIPFRRYTLDNPRKRPSSRLPPPDSSNGSPSKRHSRRPQRQSDMSCMDFSLASSKRMSGIGHGISGFGSAGHGNVNKKWSGGGHGKGDCGPPDYSVVKHSLLKTGSWISSNESDGENIMKENALKGSPNLPSGNTFGPAGPLQAVFGDNGVTIRGVTVPSQAHRSVGIARQSNFNRRARARNSANPFFSGSSRTSSHSHSRWDNKSTILSPKPAVITSQCASVYTSDNISRHPTRKTYRSYSQSSSLGPPDRPRKKASRKSIGARIDDGLARLTRSPGKSKSSVADSSNRFESAPNSSHSGDYTTGHWGECFDKDGNRKWCHIDHPNPLLYNTNREIYSRDSDGKSIEYAQGETPSIETPRRVPVSNRVSKMQRLSLSHLMATGGDGMGGSLISGFGIGGGEGSGGGSGGGARLVENKGKRVSVEAGLQGSKSVTGNVESVGHSAFV